MRSTVSIKILSFSISRGLGIAESLDIRYNLLVILAQFLDGCQHNTANNKEYLTIE